MVKLYVEGGGDVVTLKSACREGFREFITKAGLKKRPRIIACGSRLDTYESFCTAVCNGEDAMLLVDSEESVSNTCMKETDKSRWLPWSHLGLRDGDKWKKPKNGSDVDCHLMVHVMESWFLADRDALKSFFGNGFKESKLPAATRAIEDLNKTEIYRALKDASTNCKSKAPYDKGEHSFNLLSKIDPAKVIIASNWARRFIDELKKRMAA